MKRLTSVTLIAFWLTVLAPLVGVAQQSSEGSDATPEAVEEPATLVLVEHATINMTIDIGDPGQSAGDLQVWGPNALYDENNETDTGATAQGFCVMFDETSICLATETIVFADGSTLQLQGVQQPNGEMTAAIVSGTGQYLGASGSGETHASADFSLWTHTLTIWR